MIEASNLEHVNVIEELASELRNLNTSTADKNVNVDGVDYSSDVLLIHELVKNHKLVYSSTSSPAGKWVWKGLREIKKKGGDSISPAFVLPDGIGTFYGNLNYSYSTLRDDVTVPIIHDVISFSSILLDAKARSAPKSGNSGVYGVDWWNIYMPITLLKKLTTDIKQVSGYVLSQEGVIMDDTQGLVSITVNIKDESDSPNITMITTVEEKNVGEGLPGETGEVGTVEKTLEYTDMGTLKDIMNGGGEDSLIGGVGFFTVGVSCKHTANEEPPPAGTCVKLSLKMKAFHALHIIEDGIRRVSYRSTSAGLKY